jgi:hypothetical protein
MTQTPDLLMETPFFDDAAPGPSGVDVLSDILRVFHVTGAALLRGEFGAPWAWHAPPSSEIAKLLQHCHPLNVTFRWLHAHLVAAEFAQLGRQNRGGSVRAIRFLIGMAFPGLLAVRQFWRRTKWPGVTSSYVDGSGRCPSG